MSWHGYLVDGKVDNRRLVEDARRYAEGAPGAAKKFIFLLCKALERLAEKMGQR